MDDSAVFAVRAKYANDLEEIVQCPVCFERPIGSVPMCEEGHHLCRRCRNAVQVCPICKGELCDTRNFAVEELCSKLNEILSSLLDPHLSNPSTTAAPLPAPIVTKSIATQTDNNPTVVPHEKRMSLPAVGVDESVIIVDEFLAKSCRIDFCYAKMPADCMYLHLQDYHAENLIEVTLDMKDDRLHGSYFKKILCLEYDLNKLYDWALHSPELGLFFVNVHIDSKGNLLIDLARVTDHEQGDDELKYLLAVRVPNSRYPIEFDGKVLQSYLANKKFVTAHHCDREDFDYYYEDDGVTLDKSRTCTFVLSVLIRRESNNNC